MRSAERFLLGEPQQVIDELQSQMAACAEALDYEKAAEWRDRIGALSRVLHQQSVDASSLSASDRDVDILAVRVAGGRACVNLAMVRGSRHLGDRAYFPTHVDEATALAAGADDDVDETAELDGGVEREGEPGRRGGRKRRAAQCRAAGARSLHRPALPRPGGAPAAGAEPRRGSHADRGAWRSKPARRVRSVHQPREQRRIWLDMAIKGAGIALARLLAEEGSQRERTRALAEALDLDLPDPQRFRIECFDISHTAGEATQASCVVYEDHRMQNSQYRRFNIQAITGGDDYAAMRQVLTRRYAKLAEAVAANDVAASADARPDADGAAGDRAALAPGKARLPDLVLVDGGRGQVGVAREVFEELGLDLSLIVGVEKGEGRKVGLEELVFADGRAKVSLGHDSAALMLVAQIRDEAHRFAITGMRARRASVRTGGSRLEDIAGVGPKKRAQLLQRFGGVRGVANAGVDDLAAVEGISRDLAEAIYRALH